MKMEYPRVTAIDISCPVVDAVPGLCPAEYWTSVFGQIEGLTSPLGVEHFGEIQIEKLSVCDARRFGISLQELGTSWGEFMTDLFESLFTEKGQPRSELPIDPGWVDLLILWKLNIKPEYRTGAIIVQAIETAIGFLGPRDLVAALLADGSGDGLDLTAEEWEELDFQKIPGKSFAIRRSLKPRACQCGLHGRRFGLDQI
jgi:hypothetical protein